MAERSRGGHRKQQILVTRYRPREADSGFAVRSPHCQASRSVVGSAALIPIVCRAWERWQGGSK